MAKLSDLSDNELLKRVHDEDWSAFGLDPATLEELIRRYKNKKNECERLTLEVEEAWRQRNSLRSCKT